MGDTIRIRKKLARSPEVWGLARSSGLSKHEVVGLLVEFWGWADDESKGTGSILLSGLPAGVGLFDLLADAIGANNAFWESLIAVGWLRVEKGRAIIPNHDRYADKPPKPKQLTLSLENTETTDAEAGFAEFWRVYPRRENKLGARKAWMKLRVRPAMVEKILAAVERAAQTEQWKRGFIPHAATWLNNHRWEDEGGAGCTKSGRGIGSAGKYAHLGDNTTCEASVGQAPETALPPEQAAQPTGSPRSTTPVDPQTRLW